MKKVIAVKRNTIIEAISALFILLFVYTSLSKLIEFNSFKAVLKQSPLVGNMNVAVAWAIPIVELIIAGLLFAPRTRMRGLFMSMILMSVFTLYLAYMLAFTPDLPCNCGGVIKQMTWTQHFIFNIFFTLLALTGIILERKRFKTNKEVELTDIGFT